MTEEWEGKGRNLHPTCTWSPPTFQPWRVVPTVISYRLMPMDLRDDASSPIDDCAVCMLSVIMAGRCCHCLYHTSRRSVWHGEILWSPVLWPSVLWRCWLGGRKGIWPVKTEWWDVGVFICMGRGTYLHMAGPDDATATHYLLLQ